MAESDEKLLPTCEELLEFLHAHADQAKLRGLIADIEALRDRLVAEAGPAGSDGDQPRAEP
jgi:hypothetical protein